MADNDVSYALGITDSSEPASSLKKDPAVSATLRYKDGYRIARFVDGMGTGIKIVGVVLGVIVFGLFMAVGSSAIGGSQAALLFVVAILCSAVTGGIFFVLGVIVSALGQHLKAVLDTAVHSSPFLDLTAKARVMSLD